ESRKGVLAQLAKPRQTPPRSPLLKLGKAIEVSSYLFGRCDHVSSLSRGCLACFFLNIRISSLFDFQGQFRPARPETAAIDEHMDKIRHDVVQKPLVMGNHDHSALRTAQPIHAFCDDL